MRNWRFDPTRKKWLQGKCSIELYLFRLYDDLANYEITINPQTHKLCYGQERAELDTTKSRGINIEPGKVLFVQTTDGKMYASPADSARLPDAFFRDDINEQRKDPINPLNTGIPDTFHHSSFTGGRPILMGGELRVIPDKKLQVTNKSGHYQPPPEVFCKFLEWISEQLHVPLSEIEAIKYHKLNIERVIKNKIK